MDDNKNNNNQDSNNNLLRKTSRSSISACKRLSELKETNEFTSLDSSTKQQKQNKKKSFHYSFIKRNKSKTKLNNYDQEYEETNVTNNEKSGIKSNWKKIKSK